MRRTILFSAIICILFSVTVFSLAQTQDSVKPLLVLRAAKESQRVTVAVEAYLVNDILEVTIIARMYNTKPRIYNAILVGPKIGRLSSKERQTLYPRAEDEEATFPIEDMDGGYIRFSKKIKEKKAKGTLTKELLKFKIPSDKIMPNKRYELRIKVESMQTPGQPKSFKFYLKDLPHLISR